MPKVSVIMGIYNLNKVSMVSYAINSILSQTFKDFEFIICDDGSTDGTYELINKISEADNRIIIIRNPRNCGLAFSLNHCLSICRGKYIARMDSDDFCLPNRLEEQVNFLDSHNEYALVGSWSNLFRGNEVWGVKKVTETPQAKDMLFGPPFIHGSILIRSDVINKLGGYRVCKETLRAEDYDLWMRMYKLGYKGYNIQKPLYRIREDSDAYKKRTYKYRFYEAKVRYKGFKGLNLMPAALPFVIKPLIVGLIPQRILSVLRREKL